MAFQRSFKHCQKIWITICVQFRNKKLLLFDLHTSFLETINRLKKTNKPDKLKTLHVFDKKYEIYLLS